MTVDTISSITDLQVYAAKLASSLIPNPRHATVLALTGDLGAGKTAFVKGVASALGIEETVTSPTFVIMKKYPTTSRVFARLIHIDAYRLESDLDLRALDWEGLLAEPANLIAIEWPERVEKSIPEDAIRLSFEHVDDTTRRIEQKS